MHDLALLASLLVCLVLAINCVCRGIDLGFQILLVRRQRFGINPYCAQFLAKALLLLD